MSRNQNRSAGEYRSRQKKRSYNPFAERYWYGSEAPLLYDYMDELDDLPEEPRRRRSSGNAQYRTPAHTQSHSNTRSQSRTHTQKRGSTRDYASSAAQNQRHRTAAPASDRRKTPVQSRYAASAQNHSNTTQHRTSNLTQYRDTSTSTQTRHTSAGTQNRRNTAAYHQHVSAASQRTHSQATSGRGTEYVYGSAVPARRYNPESEPAQRPEPRTAPSARPRRRRSFMTAAMIAGMTASLVLMCIILVSYISLQSRVTSAVNENAALETQLATLKSDNDQRLNEINSGINLDEIKYKAITKLGMTYADDDQVVNYTNSDGDYVHQVRQASK